MLPHMREHGLIHHLAFLLRLPRGEAQIFLALLLIGTQGVGKNKITDYFFMRTGTPRQYLQLHRDTTVGALTIQPVVKDNCVTYEDSPLVKAVKYGHALVIDEIDKAPIEVVQILKGLVEDREMMLVDGRRIYSCLTLAAMHDGGAVTTIEGLGSPGALHPLQAAFIEHDALQCGYCTPGQILSAVGLLGEPGGVSDADVKKGLGGNLCRCGAYPNIVAAVQKVRATAPVGK